MSTITRERHAIISTYAGDVDDEWATEAAGAIAATIEQLDDVLAVSARLVSDRVFAVITFASDQHSTRTQASMLADALAELIERDVKLASVHGTRDSALTQLGYLGGLHNTLDVAGI